MERKQNNSEDKIKDGGDAGGNIKIQMIVTHLYEKKKSQGPRAWWARPAGRGWVEKDPQTKQDRSKPKQVEEYQDRIMTLK